LSEIHREFDCPLNVAYLDIKAASDSMDRCALWKALSGRGVPNIILNLIVTLHQNIAAQIHIGKNDIECKTRLHSCSCIILYCHMNIKPEIYTGNTQFTDVMNADDTTFFVQSNPDATDCLSSFSESSSVLDMHVSWPKTKLQDLGTGKQPTIIPIFDGNVVEPALLQITSYILVPCSHLMDIANLT